MKISNSKDIPLSLELNDTGINR